MKNHVMRNLTALVLFCAFFFAAGTALRAQNVNVFDHPLSSESLPRYTALCAEIASHPVIKGTFEQTKIIARLNRTLVSAGNFIITDNLGMVWDTRSPFPSTMAVGRDFIIQSVPGRSKSKLDARGNEAFISLAGTISAIFTGDITILREKFDNYFVETAAPAGKTWAIGLVPREQSVRAFAGRIVLSGGGKGGEIRSILIEEPGGGSIRYELSGHRYPAALESDEKALFSLE